MKTEDHLDRQFTVYGISTGDSNPGEGVTVKVTKEHQYRVGLSTHIAYRIEETNVLYVVESFDGGWLVLRDPVGDDGKDILGQFAPHEKKEADAFARKLALAYLDTLLAE